MISYLVLDVSGFVKFDVMENLYLLLVLFVVVFGEWFVQVVLNCYLVLCLVVLFDKLCYVMCVLVGCDVLFGNGFDEIISMILVVCVQLGVKVFVLVLGFVMYELLVKFVQFEFVGVLLQVDLMFDVDVMFVVIVEYWLVIVYFVYLNNLIGMLYDDVDVEWIVVVVCYSLIVIDEVYQLFVECLWLLCVVEFDNVVVMCMVLKFGFVGICFGYFVGLFVWLNEFDKVCLLYNINVLIQVIVDFLFDYFDVFDVQVVELCVECVCFVQVVVVLFGVMVFLSVGNFLLVWVLDVVVVFDVLFIEWVLVKNVSKMYLLLVECVWLIVGFFDENVCLLVVLKFVLFG